MTLDLKGMNESQLAATRWQDGALLVLAGPGSGKTRVLTYRVARLIEESPNERFRVLAVTFTNKAASEMRTRIDKLATRGRDRAHVTTFHALAAELLRQHGSHLGLRPDFMILSEKADQEAVLAEVIRAGDFDDEEFEPRSAQVLPVIVRLLEECVAPNQAEEWLRGSPHASAMASLYSAYRAALVNANQLDFGSLLALTVELLEKRPAIAAQVRRIYSHVCVDEFQDTNLAQYRLLVQLVAKPRPNLFVVADDDQIIYQWNGANPRRLRELREKFDMEEIQLPENFRCPPEVIALANSLIRHNVDRSADKLALVAHKTAGENRVTVKHLSDFPAEIAWLAGQIEQIPPSNRGDCVILARRKKLLDEAANRLAEHEIPAHVVIRKNEFQSAPFRWLHGMLRLANARQDREQIRRVSGSFAQLEGISIDVDNAIAKAALDSGDFLRAWLSLVLSRDSVQPDTRSLLLQTESSLLDRLEYWRFIETARGWFAAVEERSRDPAETAFDEYADETAAWEALLRDIGSHYTLQDLSLHQFLQELDLRAKEVPPVPNAIRCLTIHGAKGTEFRHVFLIGLVEDELPSWAAKQKGDESDDMREERRNCFVAITRTEESLALSYADEYFGWPKEPSRFLFEMGAIQ